ncbi:hypothetical protein [Streptomyces sp. NPDC058252]|uniref:hypothetical protein n=1 Tax=Streptomyces sp. NPDC058252 TaxID=3346405 RepID=UPI0036E3B97C
MSGGKKTGPPKAGSSVTVRVDEIFAEDLAVLARAGMNTTDALRWAANKLAVGFTEAWKRGTVPEGQWPEMTIMVSPPKAAPAEQEPKAA